MAQSCVDDSKERLIPPRPHQPVHCSNKSNWSRAQVGAGAPCVFLLCCCGLLLLCCCAVRVSTPCICVLPFLLLLCNALLLLRCCCVLNCVLLVLASICCCDSAAAAAAVLGKPVWRQQSFNWQPVWRQASKGEHKRGASKWTETRDWPHKYRISFGHMGIKKYYCATIDSSV